MPAVANACTTLSRAHRRGPDHAAEIVKALQAKAAGRDARYTRAFPADPWP